ncbi:MAG: hypothetical protein ACTSUU_06815 [Candidatus Thorarchaeota archaeon]
MIEFHRWLQDLADDDSSTGDDEVDITDDTPSSRSTDNIITLLGSYNIDDTAAEHLYDGSIIQGTGGTEEYYDGIVNFGNADVQIQIIQDGAVLTDDWWNFGGAGLNASAAAGISHRFMIKTRTGGADIDGRRLLGTTRTFGNTYGEFSINGSSRGNNVLALTDTNDLNNETAEGVVSGWTGITNTTEGYALIDINNDTTDEAYYSEWNTNQPTRSINDFFERMKWLTRDASAETIYGISGELFRGITHEIDVTGIASGPLSAVEELTWTEAAVVSSGQMFATNSVSAPTKVWIQLLSGIAPTDGTTLTGTTSGATIDVDTTVLERPISTPMVGVSTGTAIIGAYGFGIEKADLTAADLVFDLTNAPITPPNNVTFTVFGLENGEDRVLVTNDDTGIDYAQMTLNGALTGVTTTVTVSGSIPTDTPSSGTIRILRVSGAYTLHPYSVFSGSDFTITSHDFTSDNAANAANVFISYLDLLATGASEAFTVVYLADRTVFVRVRDGGGTPIKTFETTGTLGTSGGSSTAIRTPDA